MDTILNFLVDWGYWGMLAAAFLAGSFFPFSSEAVMLALQAAGLDPVWLVVYGTIGNILGSVFNYCVGRMGNLVWIERYLHVSRESIEKAEKFMAGLGLMRANVAISLISISIGKLLRYAVLVFGASLFI